MTEESLKEIEALVADPELRLSDYISLVSADIPRLIAEVRRLRGALENLEVGRIECSCYGCEAEVCCEYRAEYLGWIDRISTGWECADCARR